MELEIVEPAIRTTSESPPALREETHSTGVNVKGERRLDILLNRG